MQLPNRSARGLWLVFRSDTPMPDADTLNLHATAVAVNGKAVLLTGESGTGKSSLALEMLARGATLVADDRVVLTCDQQGLRLYCPHPLQGLIEARGVGLLHTDFVDDVPLALVVDMNVTETDRMPPPRSVTYFTNKLPLLHKVGSRHFAAALIQYLKFADQNGAREGGTHG